MTHTIEKQAESKLGRSYHGYRRPDAEHPLYLSAPRSHLLITQGHPILPSVDLRDHMLPIRDQGQEGACSGFSTVANREGAYWIFHGRALPEYESPAYLYGRCRAAEGTFPADSGASIADELAILQGYGCCPESCLPYAQNPAEEWTEGCDTAAKPFRIDQPMVVNYSDPVNTKQALSCGMLVTIGFMVYQSFEDTGSDGVVPATVPGEAQLGGHGVLVVGYDDSKQRWIVRNQWGSGWGDAGYFYFPYGYEANWLEAWTFKAQ